MISGTVNADREAILRLQVSSVPGQSQEIEAVVDTGFTGFLTLPLSVIANLGLTRISRGRAILANGSEEVFDIYEAQIVWDGQTRTIEADAAEVEPLIGMSMLYGYELRVQVLDGGTLPIAALP
jgi:clan AA aspartic protease